MNNLLLFYNKWLVKGNESAYSTVASSEYKLRTTVPKTPHGDLSSCIEMVKVADLSAFVASAKHHPSLGPHLHTLNLKMVS